MDQHRVVVLGASNKSHRYSNQAIRMLLEYGYHVIPVHPRLELIESCVVKHQLSQVVQPVDTLTLYVGPERSETMIDDIIALNPGRVIFNPGTESQALETRLFDKGIAFTRDCTLVMLEQGRF